MLVDVAERDLSVNLFGYKYQVPVPILLAPVDRQELYHAEGELAIARAAAATARHMQAVLDLIAHIAHNPSLTWNDIDFVRSQTKLPVLVKGILYPGEAQLALKYGASGIIMSNHGGRHLDGALGGAECAAWSGRCG